jgi:excisionase family DNA binding protein
MEVKENTKLIYTVAELQGVLGISKNLAYRLVKEGGIPGVIRLGKRLVVSKPCLDAFLASGKPMERGDGNQNQ